MRNFTAMSHKPAYHADPPATPAPPVAPEAGAGLLTPAELDGIRARNVDAWEWIAGQRYPTEEMAADAINDTTDLLGHAAGMATEAADLRRQLATVTAKLAQEGEQERQLLKRDEELRKLKAELADFKESMLAGLKEAYGQGEWLNIHFMIQELAGKEPHDD